MLSTVKMKMDPAVCRRSDWCQWLELCPATFARRLPIDHDTAVVFYNKQINISCHSPFITSLV